MTTMKAITLTFHDKYILIQIMSTAPQAVTCLFEVYKSQTISLVYCESFAQTAKYNEIHTHARTHAQNRMAIVRNAISRVQP